MVLGNGPARWPRGCPTARIRCSSTGIVMIHVELHHRDDLAEIGNEAAEHAGLVHHAERVSDPARRSACSRNMALASGSLHNAPVDAPSDCADRLQRIGMDFGIRAAASAKQADDVHRIVLERHPGDVGAARPLSRRKSGASASAPEALGLQPARTCGRGPAHPSSAALRGWRRRCGSDRRHPWRRGNSAS